MHEVESCKRSPKTVTTRLNFSIEVDRRGFTDHNKKIEQKFSLDLRIPPSEKLRVVASPTIQFLKIRIAVLKLA